MRRLWTMRVFQQSYDYYHYDGDDDYDNDDGSSSPWGSDKATHVGSDAVLGSRQSLLFLLSLSPECHLLRPMSGYASAAHRTGACSALAGGTRPGSTAQGRGSRHGRQRRRLPVRSSHFWHRSSHRWHRSSHPWHRSSHPLYPTEPSSSCRSSKLQDEAHGAGEPVWKLKLNAHLARKALRDGERLARKVDTGNRKWDCLASRWSKQWCCRACCRLYPSSRDHQPA